MLSGSVNAFTPHLGSQRENQSSLQGVNPQLRFYLQQILPNYLVTIRPGRGSTSPRRHLSPYCCAGGRNSRPHLGAASSTLAMNSPVIGGIAAERSSTG